MQVYAIGEAQASAVQSRGQPSGDQQGCSALETLDRLAALGEKGLITPEEFTKRKLSSFIRFRKQPVYPSTKTPQSAVDETLHAARTDDSDLWTRPVRRL
jgi:hypothetical protein